MALRRRPLVQKLFEFLHLMWRSLQEMLLQDATRWRRVPTGSVTALLADLKPTTQAIYLRILRDFDAFACERALPLLTRTDVDIAAYTFVSGSTKSQGLNLIAALHRCYPPLKGHLTWTAARLKVIAAAQPPVHHLPMDWLVAVGCAYQAVLSGHPRHGAILLLQWRFGLRPMEALGLHGRDLHCGRAPDHENCVSFLRVGALRGTKAGRPQIVRAWPHDEESNFLIWLFSSNTAPDARLTSLSSVSQYQAVLSKLLAAAHIGQRYTTHCPRAGWATFRFISGQPFADLREDGRWRSDNALRVYLDVIANHATLSAADVQAQLVVLRHLAVTCFLGWCCNPAAARSTTECTLCLWVWALQSSPWTSSPAMGSFMKTEEVAGPGAWQRAVLMRLENRQDCESLLVESTKNN